MRVWMIFALGVGAGLWLETSPPVRAAELSDHTTELFSGAANCAFCHDQWGRALTDRRGHSVSITEDWRGTMMAHSFRDPFWQAAMEAEAEENPKLREFIEDKCQTCHAPMARAQARAEGNAGLSARAAARDPLAGEGVGCTLCHQVDETDLGQKASFTGKFKIPGDRIIYGPYEDPVTMPMRRHVDYTPAHGKHTQDSALCATCHTLFTPIVGAGGEVAGEFPEQVPYLEWRASAYAGEGVHCQDCHLPRLDEAIRITARPPWVEAREPFWRHQFAGGNAFMLRVLSRNAARLDANAEKEQFGALIEKTRAQLSGAVALQANVERDGTDAVIQVKVENLAGHKFPTGHPYRRAWLHVRLVDGRGRKLFESGAPDRSGGIAGWDEAVTEHHDVIRNPAQVQIYQAVMGDAQGQPTWSLLRAARYLKDNRIPPRGFEASGADAEHVATMGQAARDDNFNRHRAGSDVVTYRVALDKAPAPLAAEVELLYQTVPPESVRRFEKSPGAKAQEFLRLYRKADKAPEVVKRVRVELERP